MLKKIYLIGLAFILTACATETIPEMSAEQLYIDAYAAFQSKDYAKSAELFDEIEKQHPYSIWAERAQIMAAYAYYQKNEYEDAILTLERFIQLHPGNRNTPYAYYLKGLCYFEQVSDPAREQAMAQHALTTFDELIARFPRSVYIADAQAKQAVLINNLAAKEMDIGRYYYARNEFIPALNRFQTVILEYPETNQAPEAYYRLSAAYLSLGLTPEAKEAADYLMETWPESPWTRRVKRLPFESK